MFKVLIVDDEPLVIEGLKTMVDWEKHGFSICGEASNGEDALEMIKQMNPHLVITDICMPVIDGLTLIKEASKIRNIRARFVILSGYNDFEYAKTAMQYDVNHYILKPIDDEEIETLLERLNKEIQDGLKSQESVDQAVDFITENVIHRILHGEKRESLFQKAGFLLGIKEEMEIRYIFAEIDQFHVWMNDLEEEEIREKKQQIQRWMQEKLQMHMKQEALLYIYEDHIDGYGILVWDQAYERMDWARVFAGLREYVFQRCGAGISIFISNSMEGIRALPGLYEQTTELRNYRFFNRIKHVFLYDEVKEDSVQYKFYEENLEDILQAVQQDNKLDIEKSIDAVFHKFYSYKAAPNMIETYITNLKAEMIRIVSELNGPVEEFAKWVVDYKIDIHRTNFTDLKEIVVRLCAYAARYILNLQKKDSANLIEEIEKYIAANYAEALKLQNLADKFYINPVYLGQLFKKKTRMYFNEYLHRVRIEEAKKLLQRTDMKVSDIASAVGYKDTEYFTNKFKSITNTIPSTFKKVGMRDRA